MTQAVILSGVRTPIGSFGGALKDVPAPRLGAVAIKAAIERAGVLPDQVDSVIMGNVLSGGVGQAPARQAAIYAGLPTKVPCMTINKVCGSGLKAVMLASQEVRLGDSDVVVAGGMENMSRAPYILPDARYGYRMGDGKMVDLMVHDGLWDPYHDYHMGNAAELCARECEVPRDAQDAFATESYRRAIAAWEAGKFAAEVVAVPVPQRKGDPVMVTTDEEPGRGDASKFARLRPAFAKDGTVTAANASSINDGAAAVVVASQAAADRLGVKPVARILGYATHAQDPEWFTTAPAFAIEAVLRKLGMGVGDIDLFEINEAFAVVSLAVNQKLGLDPAKVNIYGGAVALGHPIGASGARVLVTLLNALAQEGKRLGLASLCIGGGEAVAVVVERL